MYVKKISIQNYRNFAEPAFELLLKPFTLILGENNVGKTNLLNALCLIFTQEISVPPSHTLELDDLNYDTVTRFRKQVAELLLPPDQVVFPEVVVSVVLADMNEDQGSVVGDWFCDTDLTEAQITYRYSLRASFDYEKWITQQRELLTKVAGPSNGPGTSDNVASVPSSPDGGTAVEPLPLWQRVEFPIGDYRYSIYGGGRPTNECDSHFLRMLKVELLDALRDARRELTAGGEYRLLYRVLNQGQSSKYADLKERLLELEQCVRTNVALHGIKEEVTKLLERVSLQTAAGDNTIDFQFSSPDAAELLKKIGMIYGSNPINVQRNGLGRNNLLYISLVLSQVAKFQQPPGAMSGDAATFFRVVGIEEPEAHLHPHLQDHLARNIEAIRSENSETIQLLLSSHSTHVAAKLSLENTVVLFLDGDSGRICSHYILDGIDTEKEKDSIRFLSLYLDATKSRMFFSRRLILVEGIAEQTLIPRFFQLYKGDTLERYGTTVLNVNGVAFKHFLKIIKNGYFLKCSVLTDRDTGKETEQRATGLKTDFDDGTLIQVAISQCATFERDLIHANKCGPGKRILLEALEDTRPQLARGLSDDCQNCDIDVDRFFGAVEGHKAEFAFNLSKRIDQGATAVVIPEYIRNAFAFVV
jgi:predicted ATP-dependent endonuclease of OLD family